jgi:hypothetical protein
LAEGGQAQHGARHRDGKPRAYRFGYGVLDENLNFIADATEKKVYFEVSDFSHYVFFENPR